MVTKDIKDHSNVCLIGWAKSKKLFNNYYAQLNRKQALIDNSKTYFLLKKNHWNLFLTIKIQSLKVFLIYEKRIILDYLFVNSKIQYVSKIMHILTEMQRQIFWQVTFSLLDPPKSRYIWTPNTWIVSQKWLSQFLKWKVNSEVKKYQKCVFSKVTSWKSTKVVWNHVRWGMSSFYP